MYQKDQYKKIYLECLKEQLLNFCPEAVVWEKYAQVFCVFLSGRRS